MKISPTALTMVPPGPVSDKIDLEIRGAVRNRKNIPATARIRVFNADTPEKTLHEERCQLPAGGVRGFSFFQSTTGLQGEQSIIMETVIGDERFTEERKIRIIPVSSGRSSGLIGGAWISFLLWSEEEAAKWNNTLRTFNDDDWREVLRGMHEIGMDVVVVQETWRNPVWYGEHYHQMTLDNYRETYKGKAFYPSDLWPDRMKLPINDPLKAVLDEAEKLGMQVLLAVGMYAHFDYTPGSLAWHKEVVSELWQRYGHYRSLYGWYIAEELSGSVKPHEIRYWDRTEQFRQEVVTFFREFRRHCDTFAPDKVIMLAPSVQTEAFAYWEKIAAHCNIIAVQGYQRAPKGNSGMSHEESIRRMQDICAANGSHLWMDMEIFGFEHPDKDGPQAEGYSCILPDGTEGFVPVPLIPQNIETSIASLKKINQLEFTVAFQYPGIMCHPEASKKPGGTPAVKYFEAYQRYRKTIEI